MNYQVFDNLCSQFANYVRGEIHDLQPRGDQMSDYMMDAFKQNESLVLALAESAQMRVFALEYMASQQSITIKLNSKAIATTQGEFEWDQQLHDVVDAIAPSLANNIGMSERLVRQFIYEAWSDDMTWLGEAAAGVISEVTVMNLLRREFEATDE